MPHSTSSSTPHTHLHLVSHCRPAANRHTHATPNVTITDTRNEGAVKKNIGASIINDEATAVSKSRKLSWNEFLAGTCTTTIFTQEASDNSIHHGIWPTPLLHTFRKQHRKTWSHLPKL